VTAVSRGRQEGGQSVREVRQQAQKGGETALQASRRSDSENLPHQEPEVEGAAVDEQAFDRAGPAGGRNRRAGGGHVPVAKVEVGREKIATIVLEKAAKITPEFGIELVDVRFQRINYVETVQQKVFERMISERKRIAERSRSEGQGRAAEIRGQKERDVLAASSAGYRSAQEIKGEADGKATAIYARAYGRDPDLFQFVRSLEALEATLGKEDTVVLSTDSELLRYLKGVSER